MRAPPWAVSALALVAAAPRCAADPHLFADLDDEAVAQRDYQHCEAQTLADCSTEFQTGRFNGAQHHTALESEHIILDRLLPPKIHLLVLFTSVWRNRQRRRLLRAALRSCITGIEPHSVIWRFLMGDGPSDAAARRQAAEEVAASDDMMLLGTRDEMNYAHIGDAYELKEPNPELVKIVLALRFFTRALDFKFLLVADDDSFVNFRSAVELTQLLPAGRVYVGNMIDTIPQRYDEKLQGIRPEYTVNIYLSTPSKVPVFAHGMGFMLSRDVAQLVAEVGLRFKARGNDDLLLGVWLRNIEHLHYLHYWPWFHDHLEFGGVFSTPCDEVSVVVHRMTPERWRTFDAWGCHLCGPAKEAPVEPLEEGVAGEASPPATPASGAAAAADAREAQGLCLSVSDLVCKWAPVSIEEARARHATCVPTCLSQAVANFTLPFEDQLGLAAAGFKLKRQRPRGGTGACPPSLCHALCQPPDGPTNSLCPGGVGAAVRSRVRRQGRLRSRPELAVLVFGSRWVADFELRQLLRASLRACTSERLGTRGGVQHLFVMGAFPSRRAVEARRSAAEEILRWQDMVLAARTRPLLSSASGDLNKTAGLCPRPAKWCSHVGATLTIRDCDGDGIPDPLCTDDAGNVGFRGSARNCTDTWPRGTCEAPETGSYAYAEAWRIVEERFGGADFVMYVDHRSYVNVPNIAHVIVPRMHRTGVYLGCFLDETLLGGCSGKDNSRCGYLFRRRAPMFAHGMGFIVTSDVARFVDGFVSQMPLREDDMPADIAFGMWVQAFEDLRYDSVHDYFHEWRADAWNDGYNGPGLTRHGLDLSLPLSDSSGVVFPMTPERWRASFEPFTCRLGLPAGRSRGAAAAWAVWWPAGGVSGGGAADQGAAGGAPSVGQSPPPLSQPPAQPSPSGRVDCWTEMGGRPEQWYLVCCEKRWSACWGGPYTEQLCCRDLPPPRHPSLAKETPSPAASLETLRRFLDFRHDEMRLLLVELEGIVANRSGDSAHGAVGPVDGGLVAAAAPAAGSEYSPVMPLFPCLEPRDCAREAFARLYRHFWTAGVLPLRHPWFLKPDDHLAKVAMKLAAESSVKSLANIVDRVQFDHWLKTCAERIHVSEVPGERRCLEWDSTQLSRQFFDGHCRYFDVIAYDGNHTPRVFTGDRGSRRYLLDWHNAEGAIPANSLGVVICTNVFEHLQRPHVAMEQLFRAVAPGGIVVWSAPLFSQIHGSPEDYWRFTPQGARMLATVAGFTVMDMYTPGNLKELLGNFLGMTVLYWPEAELVKDTKSRWPLQVAMLLRKP